MSWPLKSDVGETLVETLVAVALLGIAAVAVIGSVTMGVRAANMNVGNGSNQNLVRDWAEQIEAMPYDLCAQTTAYQSVVPPPAGTTLTITQIRYWDGAAYQVSTPSCVDANDEGLQEIALLAQSASATGTEQFPLVIVKRRECASGC